ncbi:MAG: peptidase MA family metallohydrolase [Vicinamibacterales bacterium]
MLPSCRVGRSGVASLCLSLVAAASASARAQSPVPQTGVGRPPIVREVAPQWMLYRGAQKALAAGDLERAEALAGGLASHPALAEAIRGRIALARGDVDLAVQRFRASVAADATSEGAVDLGLLELGRGRRAEATALLAPVVAAGPSFENPAELGRAARAAQALGNFRQANAFFRTAANVAPDDPAIQTAWGDLFLEKFNRAEAVRSYQMAVRADAAWAPAHLGLARALAADNPPKAAATAKHALTLNPRLAGAHVLLAELSLDESRRDEAAREIDLALELDSRHLEARALRASIAWLEGRSADYQAEVAKALAINPKYGEIYRVVGEHVARAYRFEEAVELVKQGIALDPDNSRAHASLGAHLLRTGDESAARAALERAFKVDPYDAVTYNHLSLLDTLDKFETFTEGDVTLRLDPAEAPVLHHYAMPLAKQALAALSEKYQLKPRGPILVEVFPKHDDFAVRTVGLPGMVGALGACFGRVVTMDSPKARPPGFFSWRATLWHELAHVITLQMSGNRIPRWLTEGISVYEERQADEAWGRESELTYIHLLESGQAIPLKDLNASFSDPEKISMAYFQASLLVEHIVERFGRDRLHALIAGYKTSIDADGPVQPALGVTLEGLQPGFDAYLETRYAKLRHAMSQPKGVADQLEKAAPDALVQLADAHADVFTVQMSVGKALVEAKAYGAARRVLERAVAIMPLPAGAAAARTLLADVAEQEHDLERARAELDAVVKADATAVTQARRLAELATAAGDDARLRTAASRIIAVDPFDALPHAILGRLALKANDTATALREFKVAIDAGPADQAGAHTDLAEAYVKVGQLPDAKRSALAALEIAPRYERAQELLLTIVDRK